MTDCAEMSRKRIVEGAPIFNGCEAVEQWQPASF